ncbi:MAG TPA: hypothetical protein VIY73_26520, partial [Polyangiaceae bacterium]
TSFEIAIVAYNEASFPAALVCPVGATEAGPPVSCPGDDPATLIQDEGTPTWTATCTATQQSGVPVLASCTPLVPTGLSGDAGPDGGTDASGAGDSATTDADAGNSTDASDAASPGEGGDAGGPDAPAG